MVAILGSTAIGILRSVGGASPEAADRGERVAAAPTSSSDRSEPLIAIDPDVYSFREAATGQWVAAVVATVRNTGDEPVVLDAFEIDDAEGVTVDARYVLGPHAPSLTWQTHYGWPPRAEGPDRIELDELHPVAGYEVPGGPAFIDPPVTVPVGGNGVVVDQPNDASIVLKMRRDTDRAGSVRDYRIRYRVGGERFVLRIQGGENGLCPEEDALATCGPRDRAED